MIIEINLSDCNHLVYLSYYNHNYYRMPIKIDDTDIILEKCDEDYDSYQYYLIYTDGTEKPYGCNYGFNDCKDKIILDSKFENVTNT